MRFRLPEQAENLLKIKFCAQNLYLNLNNALSGAIKSGKIAEFNGSSLHSEFVRMVSNAAVVAAKAMQHFETSG